MNFITITLCSTQFKSFFLLSWIFLRFFKYPRSCEVVNAIISIEGKWLFYP
jgi:hypothetical protein